MKRLFALLVAIVIALVAYATADAQPCLVLEHPHTYNYVTNEGWNNPDSVMVDTCSSDDYFERLYTKKYFIIQLEYDMYPFPQVLSSNQYLRPSDMLPIVQSLKDSLMILEQRIGQIYFTGIKGPNNFSDSSLIKNPVIRLYFENYQKINTIHALFDSLPYVKYFTYENQYVQFTSIPNDPALLRTDISLDDINSYPNTLNQDYPSNWQPNGYQTCLYQIKTPLAWEITKGRSDIIIAFNEPYYLNESTHPDITTNIFAPTSIGDGLPYNKLMVGEGLRIASTAIAMESSSPIGHGPMIGSSPQCKGIIAVTSAANKIDVDGVRDWYVTPPDVMNVSYARPIAPKSGFTTPGFGSYFELKGNMNYGIVTIVSAGDDRKCQNSAEDVRSKLRKDGITELFPAEPHPSAFLINKFNYSDNTEIISKALCVAAVKPGDLRDNNCDLWTWPSTKIGPNFSNEVQFIDSWNFSIGNEKFSESSDIDQWYAKRYAAFIDVVAPGAGILCANEVQGASTCDVSYGIGTDDWIRCKTSSGLSLDDVKLDAKKYGIFWGASQSTGLVSGVVGLMLSINKYIGVPIFNNNGHIEPVHGTSVQEKSYNIITFTAKKISDYQNFSTEMFNDSKHGGTPSVFSTTNEDGQSIQYDYKTQWNDKLKRSWAQRVGFGLVDAYRCVAHAIMQKGAYEYTNSNQLVFNYDNGAIPPDSRGFVNPNGIRLMHWGSKIKEGTGNFEAPLWRGANATNEGELNVLEYGGVSLPDEFHNNQGVTKLNGANLHLEVPTDCILAIDGILTTDHPDQRQYVSTQGSLVNGGKILMEGYIKDVEIYGNIKLGDLILESSYESPTFGESGCVGFGSGYESEIYGNVEVKNKGLLYSWGNLTMQPGASVTLNGEKNFILRPNSWANLTLKHNTLISSVNRKLEINNTTRAIIPTHAQVDLDCEVYVAKGGVLEIQEEGIVRIKKLTVEKGGIVQAAKGAIIALSDNTHIVKGNMEFNGDWNKRVQVIGYLTKHCRPFSDELFTDFQYIEKAPTIFMIGECDSLNSKLTLNYTTFKNVALDLSNVEILDYINQCEFLSSTKNHEPEFGFDYLLSIYYNRCDSTCKLPPVVMRGCTFSDVSGYTLHPSSPNDRNRDLFNTGGLKLEGISDVQIANSYFNNLEYGIISIECGKESGIVDLTRNYFTNCGIGEEGILSKISLCQNHFTNVQFGSIRNHCYSSRALQNNYKNVRIGYIAESSQDQKLRGNKFSRYYRGILASNTKMILNQIPDGQGRTIIYGRNTFITELSDDSTEYVRCDTNYIADIGIGSANTNIQVHCGYNLFSTYARYHVYNESLVASYPSIDFNYNTMPRPGGMYIPAVYGVGPIFDPSNIDGRYNNNDELLCCSDKILPGVFPCGVNFAGDSCVDILPFMFKPYGDGDKNNEYTWNLLSKYENALNTGRIDEFVANYKKGLGTDYYEDNFFNEYLNNKESKNTYFDLVKKQRKNISDKKQSQNSSGLLASARNAYLTDCDELSSTNETMSTIGIRVEPNPSNNIAKITYLVNENARVLFRIYDNLGNIQLEKDYGRVNSGVKVYDFDVSALTSGVYYVVIDVNGKLLREKIVVSK